MSSQGGGGGVPTLCTIPLDPPLSCRLVKLSCIVWTHLFKMWLSTLEIGAEQLRFVTEIALKSPFLCVNRCPVQYDFVPSQKLGSLSKRRFWATHVNRKWDLFRFKAPWRFQIWVSWCLYYYRNDLSENLGETTVHEWKNTTSGWPASLKNVCA